MPVRNSTLIAIIEITAAGSDAAHATHPDLFFQAGFIKTGLTRRFV